jgi:hypothetical protein
VHDIEDFEVNLIYTCFLIISIIKLFITKIRVMSHSCQQTNWELSNCRASTR